MLAPRLSRKAKVLLSRTLGALELSGGRELQFSDLDMDLLVSEPRMDTYRDAAVKQGHFQPAAVDCLADSEKLLHVSRRIEIAAARLYFWDSHVAASLWPWISFAEVVIRNSMNDHLCDYFDVSLNEGWHTLVRNGETFIKDSNEGDLLKSRFILLTSKDYEAFDRKLSEVKRRKRSNSITGDLFVGKVSLGIWISLLNEGSSAPGKGHLNYEQTLWEPCLRDAFPNSDGRRARLRDQLNQFARLRNRIAHHEHLLGRNISKDLARLVEIVGYVDENAAQLIDHANSVPEALDRRDDFLAGRPYL